MDCSVMAKNEVVFEDADWRAIKAEMDKAGKSHVRVGVLASQGGDEILHDGDLTLAEIAAVHEFGTADGHIPSRSFIRRAVIENRDAIVKKQAELSLAVMLHKIDIDKALNLLGVFIVALVKATIEQGSSIPPPLAESTVERKGSSRALVDTGQLVNSINHEVED